MTLGLAPKAIDALRAAVHDLHEAVEQLPIMKPLSRGDITPSEYLTALKALYGFYRPMERFLFTAGMPAACTMPVKPKSDALKQDILGMGVEAGEIPALPMCGNLPPLLTPNERVGALYVLEGATLGGRTILRRIASGLGASAGMATSFHGFHGDQLGPSWRRVQEYLGHRLDGDHAGILEAVGGAKATFEALSMWLASPRLGSSSEEADSLPNTLLDRLRCGAPLACSIEAAAEAIEHVRNVAKGNVYVVKNSVDGSFCGIPQGELDAFIHQCSISGSFSPVCFLGQVHRMTDYVRAGVFAAWTYVDLLERGLYDKAEDIRSAVLRCQPERLQ